MGAALELDGMVKTFEHSQASLGRTSHTRLIKAWAKRQAIRIGLSKIVRRECRIAGVQSGPNPSCNQRGTWKSRFIPVLAVPRQADRKAGPGETAWRGSNKPRPLCNGADMPTSIWSFIVRESMEPFLLRKANDDRRPSIGASQSRRKDRRALRPPMSMTKVGSKAPLTNRDILYQALSLERLEPCEGKLSRTVLRGAGAGNRSRPTR